MYRTSVSAKPILFLAALGLTAGAMTCSFRPVRASADPESEILTIEQTMGLALSLSRHGGREHLYARATPDAKEALYRVLADDSLRRCHEIVWMIIGHIGGEEDVDRVARTIQEDLSGVLGRDEEHVLYAMFDAVGVMGRRGVGGARDLLIRWQDPSFWRAANFRLRDRPIPDYPPPFEYEVIFRVMVAYARSEPPDMRERVEAVLSRIDDAKLRDWMAASLVTAEELAAFGERVRASESLPPSPEELRMLEGVFNGDLDHPGPRRPVAPARPMRRDGARAAGSPPAALPREPAAALRALGAQMTFGEGGSIERVALSGPQVTDEVLRRAAQLPGLRELILGMAPVTDGGLAHLESMRSLRRLSIGNCRQITERASVHLEALTRLEHLELRDLPSFGDAGLESLRGLTNLRMLVLSRTRITDEGLEALAGLQNLERLYLYDTPITGEGLRHLRGLDRLEILLLRGTKLDDAGLAHLEGMTGLDQVVLGDTTSDSYRDEVTDDGIARLKRALPDCKIQASRLKDKDD